MVARHATSFAGDAMQYANLSLPTPDLQGMGPAVSNTADFCRHGTHPQSPTTGITPRDRGAHLTATPGPPNMNYSSQRVQSIGRLALWFAGRCKLAMTGTV